MVRAVTLLRLGTAAVLAAFALPAFAQIHGVIDEKGIARWDGSATAPVYVLTRDIPLPDPGPSYARPPMPREIDLSQSNPAPAPAIKAPHADIIDRVAREQRVDPALVHAVVAVESAYNPRARSPKGAAGLMQLMPATAQRYGVRDIWSPLENVQGGVRYLRDLLTLFKGDVRLALAAYNAGENAVLSYGGRIPPYAETRNYVPRVINLYERYRGKPEV